MPRPPDWYADTNSKALEVFINLQRRMTVHALQAIEDDEPEGYLAFVDAEGIMKDLFYKPIVDRWEESAEI
jgi:hypothetical protein